MLSEEWSVEQCTDECGLNKPNVNAVRGRSANLICFEVKKMRNKLSERTARPLMDGCDVK